MPARRAAKADDGVSLERREVHPARGVRGVQDALEHRHRVLGRRNRSRGLPRQSPPRTRARRRAPVASRASPSPCTGRTSRPIGSSRTPRARARQRVRKTRRARAAPRRRAQADGGRSWGPRPCSSPRPPSPLADRDRRETLAWPFERQGAAPTRQGRSAFAPSIRAPCPSLVRADRYERRALRVRAVGPSTDKADGAPLVVHPIEAPARAAHGDPSARAHDALVRAERSGNTRPVNAELGCTWGGLHSGTCTHSMPLERTRKSTSPAGLPGGRARPASTARSAEMTKSSARNSTPGESGRPQTPQ